MTYPASPAVLANKEGHEYIGIGSLSHELPVRTQLRSEPEQLTPDDKGERNTGTAPLPKE